MTLSARFMTSKPAKLSGCNQNLLEKHPCNIVTNPDISAASLLFLLIVVHMWFKPLNSYRECLKRGRLPSHTLLFCRIMIVMSVNNQLSSAAVADFNCTIQDRHLMGIALGYPVCMFLHTFSRTLWGVVPRRFY